MTLSFCFCFLKNTVYSFTFIRPNNRTGSSSSSNIGSNRDHQQQPPLVNNEGWQSKRFCSYPQSILLQPLLEDNRQSPLITTTAKPTTIMHLCQMQILAHNQKIPKRIDIHISETILDGRSKEHSNDNQLGKLTSSSLTPTTTSPEVVVDEALLQKIQFKRLGYITFDNNSKTNYRARELKSISLDVSVTFVKLVIHECHGYHESNNGGVDDMNSMEKTAASSASSGQRKKSTTKIINPFDQVGIVQIQLFGEDTIEEGEEEEEEEKEAKNTSIHKPKEDEISSILLDAGHKNNIASKIEGHSNDKIKKASVGINTTFDFKDGGRKWKGCNNKSNNSSRKKRRSLNPKDIDDFQSRLATLEKKKLEMASREVSV